jgi:hypothetical protein
VLGAHVQGGVRMENDAYIDLDNDGVGAGLSSEFDVFGVETGNTLEGRVGLEGASIGTTQHTELGDQNMNVGTSTNADAHVDITSGVSGGASVGLDTTADIRGFDLGAGGGGGVFGGIGGDGLSYGGEGSVGVTVGGTDVDVSVGTESKWGLEGGSMSSRGEVSGVGGVSGEIDIGGRGVGVKGSVDLGDMHAEGGIGTDDLANAWDDAGDAAHDAGQSAGDAWSDAEDAGQDAADDAEEGAGDAWDDTGESTGLW